LCFFPIPILAGLPRFFNFSGVLEEAHMGILNMSVAAFSPQRSIIMAMKDIKSIIATLKIAFGVVVCAVGLIFGLIWVYNHFARPISIEEPVGNSASVACLHIQANLTLVSFDGQKIRRSAAMGSRAASVKVPEGKHTLEFDFKETVGDTTTTAEGFELNIPFETGQYYYVNYKKEGKKIQVYWDNTEEGVYRDPKK
jgi:hypothetical protein